MLDQSFYQKADEIIAFYGKKPASLIPQEDGKKKKEMEGIAYNVPEQGKCH